MDRNALLPDVRDTNISLGLKPVAAHMPVGEKTAEATAKDGGSQPKPPSRGSARFERLLSGLGAGPLVDVEPDKVKDDIRRWAKKVAALVRQLSFGAWAEKSDGSSEHRGAGDDGSAAN
ncbi:hypothetical protein BDA96_03G294500 [Sorghum bicolor]|uniref:Uncharacterized protein n=1 Tax=Sorghum bicolor TaxID=4558 RepID=A0A921UNZ2_SORBI|nr:hypothetical protein BDA96_03G294500 [Sorghum bicolor]